MNEIQTRALARNSYTLDMLGLGAHLRDTLVSMAMRRDRSSVSRAIEHRPRSAVGPSIRGGERHFAADSWRIR